MAARHQFLGPSLGENRKLIVVCGKCGHEVRMPGARALRLFGPGATPYLVRRRLRCSQCGEKDRIDVGVAFPKR